MDRAERILGGLFGVACGDALGGPLEFMSEEDGRQLYGHHREMTGGGLLKLKPGDVTDDTMMTIAVAEGIILNPENPVEEMGKKFVEWYCTNPPDIGITCKEAISRYLICQSWDMAALYAHNISGGRSAGNGSLMRCIPPALYYRNFDRMLKVTEAQSKMTHYDSKASEACLLYNTLVYQYLSGEEKETAAHRVLKNNKEYSSLLTMDKNILRPSGYVVDSFKCALYCFLNNDNFEDTVIEAVNLYGDPDTIGAIAGGIAGVYYGFESIPERWKSVISVKEKLIELSDIIERNDKY